VGFTYTTYENQTESKFYGLKTMPGGAEQVEPGFLNISRYLAFRGNHGVGIPLQTSDGGSFTTDGGRTWSLLPMPAKLPHSPTTYTQLNAVTLTSSDQVYLVALGSLWTKREATTGRDDADEWNEVLDTSGLSPISGCVVPFDPPKLWAIASSD